MQNLVKRLEKKGWKKREIKDTLEIIKDAKANSPKEIKFLDRRIYWILLFVIIAANFAISIALIPILIALKGTLLFTVVIILGLVFGLLFELVIRSIEHLENHHHLLLAIFIPATALINIFFIINYSNYIMEELNVKNQHPPAMIAIAYASSFIIPYIIYRYILRIEYYAKE